MATLRIFLFDPCFGRMTGHWENYCKRFYNELQRYGYQVTVYGQKDPDPTIIEGVNFRPVFQHLPFLEMKNMEDFHHQARAYYRDFKSIDDNEFQAGDLLIFHSIFSQILGGLLQWTEELVAKHQVKIGLLFQFSPSVPKRHASYKRRIYYTLQTLIKRTLPDSKLEWLENKEVNYYRSLNNKLSELVKSGTHVLLTSTDVLANNFSALFKLPVVNLPMPGPHYELENEVDSPLIYEKGSMPPITIGYFGHSSLEKGGHFLEFIVKSMRQLYPSAKFILHINPNPDTTECLKYFEKNTDSHVQCHFNHISQELMLSLMKKVDVILLPYSPEKYMTTPSAIFSEAMPLGKIFVLPGKTWMHKEARQYKTGFVTFYKHSAQHILKALVQAILKFEYLREKSKVSAKVFYSHNNISNYTEQFLSALAIHKRNNQSTDLGRNV